MQSNRGEARNLLRGYKKGVRGTEVPSGALVRCGGEATRSRKHILSI